MDDRIIIWVFGFFAIWFLFMWRQKEWLWRLIGSALLFICSLLGVYIVDNIFGEIIMFVFLLYFFKELTECLTGKEKK